MARACSRWRRRRRVDAMPRASRLVALVALVAGGGVAAAQPLPKVQPQPSSMTPAQAMQANALPPELPRVEVLAFDAAVARAVQRNPSAAVALEEIARARAIV